MSNIAFGHFRAGIDAVRGAKARSFWMVLGVIIGVASVITIVGIGNGIKQQIAGQIHHLGKNIIAVTPSQPQTSSSNSKGLGSLSGLALTQPLTLKDINTVKSVNGVGASAPLTIAAGSVVGEYGKYDEGYVIGTSGDLPSLLNQSMAYGSFFGSEDEGVNVAVIGQKASDKMFKSDVPLGHSFTYHGETFIVRGIFNQFNSTALSQNADFNNAIFIPNDVAENLTKNTAPTYQILARANNAEQTNQVAADIRNALNKSHGGQSNTKVLVGNQNVTSSDSILNLLTKLIAGVAAISLIVSGIGIMNVMLVSVSERKHEIGIRKAVGATNRQILSQFMIESSVLTMVGGAIGIALAFFIEIMMRAFTDIKPVITWQIVLLATGVSLLVGIVFGTVPAVKAARKDPIEALRSE